MVVYLFPSTGTEANPRGCILPQSFGRLHRHGPSDKLCHPNPQSRRTAGVRLSHVLNHKEDAIADSLEPVRFLRLANQWPA